MERKVDDKEASLFLYISSSERKIIMWKRNAKENSLLF